MATLFDAFSSGPANQAAADQTAAIEEGLQALNKQYGQGRQALTTDYAAALAPWTQQAQYAGQGQTALGNALGLNGAAGNAAATAAFQNNPGYQFQLQQGLNAVLANNAAAGNLASGKTTTDELNYATGLANQSWNQYVQNLQPFLGAGQNAAQGIAGVNTGLGNAMNQNYTGAGQAAAQAYGAMGNAEANAALAPYQIGANLLGAAGGLASGATKLATAPSTSLFGSMFAAPAAAA